MFQVLETANNDVFVLTQNTN